MSTGLSASQEKALEELLLAHEVAQHALEEMSGTKEGARLEAANGVLAEKLAQAREALVGVEAIAYKGFKVGFTKTTSTFYPVGAVESKIRALCSKEIADAILSAGVEARIVKSELDQAIANAVAAGLAPEDLQSVVDSCAHRLAGPDRWSFSRVKEKSKKAIASEAEALAIAGVVPWWTGRRPR